MFARCMVGRGYCVSSRCCSAGLAGSWLDDLRAAIAIRAATEPSNSAIVTVAAALIGSRVAISIVSRLIRNRALARIVAWLGWFYVALRITGATDDVARALDALAIRIGALRISAYDVIEAAIVVAAVLGSPWPPPISWSGGSR